MFSYDSLLNHYKTNFQLVQLHKYSLTELEAMVPWERHLYISFLRDLIEKENEQKIQEASRRKAAAGHAPPPLAKQTRQALR